MEFSGSTYLDIVISEDGTQNDFDSFDFFTEPLIGDPAGPPENAYRSTYSSSAVEIFWEKPSGWEPKFYSVYRDGSFIAFTEGRSFYEGWLNPGTFYIYEIFAEEPLTGVISIVPAFVVVVTNDR